MKPNDNTNRRCAFRCAVPDHQHDCKIVIGEKEHDAFLQNESSTGFGILVCGIGDALKVEDEFKLIQGDFSYDVRVANIAKLEPNDRSLRESGLVGIKEVRANDLEQISGYRIGLLRLSDAEPIRFAKSRSNWRVLFFKDKSGRGHGSIVMNFIILLFIVGVLTLGVWVLLGGKPGQGLEVFEKAIFKEKVAPKSEVREPLTSEGAALSNTASEANEESLPPGATLLNLGAAADLLHLSEDQRSGIDSIRQKLSEGIEKIERSLQQTPAEIERLKNALNAAAEREIKRIFTDSQRQKWQQLTN